MHDPVLQDDNIEAKVSKDVIDNLSTDIASKYDEKLSLVEEKELSNYVWVSFLVGLLALIVSYSPVGTYVKERVVTYLEFQAKSAFGKDVKMAENLKLLVKDDNLIAYMGRPNLNISEWADLLYYVSLHKPKAIYIDKIFSVTGMTNDELLKNKEFNSAIDKISKIETPIYIGASVHKRKISLRHSLKFQDSIHDIGNYFDVDTLNNTPEHEKTLLDNGLGFLAKQNPELVYSRHPGYKEAFQSASIHYFSERYVYPLMLIGKEKILPHIGLLASGDVKLTNSNLMIDGNNAWIRNQKVNINYLKPEQVFSQARTIKNLVRRIERQKQTGKFYSYAKFLKPGDHVFIIPEFFTGSTDFKNTPFGKVFGGLIPTSLMNSSITGEWIREMDSPILSVLYLVLVAIITSSIMPLFGWMFLVASNAVIVFSGLYLFSFYGLAIPWFFTAVFSLVLGGSIMILKAKSEKKRQEIVEEMKLETEMISKENLLFEENQKVLLQEKREAAMIASAFSPDPIPVWDFVKITGHHKCFDAASGDWFFFEKSQNGRFLHTIMCDITGHGVQAALIVSTCKTILNTIKQNDPQLINEKDFALHYLKMLNSILYIQGKTHHVTTFAGITVEPGANLLHYVTCAHPPPILHRVGEPLEKPKLLRMRNDPVGYEPDVNTDMETVDFNVGDKIVVNTDGIPITENFRFYKNYLKSHVDTWSEDPLAIYNYLWECIGKKTGKDPDDDVSIMIIEMTGKITEGSKLNSQEIDSEDMQSVEAS
jgi:serine phosphatase RsbU (regulator of sigma subunit)